MPARRPRAAILAAALLAVLLVVVGALSWVRWGPTGLPPAPTPSIVAEGADIPEDLRPFYEQQVQWSACEGSFECATVEVPLDYEAPDAESIALALKRLPAADPGRRIGSLLINPGGPGVSGVTLVSSAKTLLGRPVLESYDVVGFDPRGVGQSTPVECVEPAELDELRAKVYDTEGRPGVEEFRADMRGFAEACEANSGQLLGFVDTVSVARDLDVLREVLGDSRLHYLGYSYGSLLGATYAELFPGRVGRLVLDGAVDPALGPEQERYAQAAGFESALRAYVEDCLAGSGCPVSGDVDEGVAQVQRFLELLVGSPLPTEDGRELTQSLAVSGILVTLYDDRYWPILTEALTSAMQERDGTALLYLADFLANRNPDGTYSTNSVVAIRAVSCLDDPVKESLEAMDAEAQRLREISPTFGEFLAYSDIVCQEWPVESRGQTGPIHARGAAPILVVGTTHDPATPYAWAESLAEQLESGHLLTYDGQGHTAYGRSNECIRDAVDRYLVRGELPHEGLVC